MKRQLSIYYTYKEITPRKLFHTYKSNIKTTQYTSYETSIRYEKN